MKQLKQNLLNYILQYFHKNKESLHFDHSMKMWVAANYEYSVFKVQVFRIMRPFSSPNQPYTVDYKIAFIIVI